jgi:hypothetical protein
MNIKNVVKKEPLLDRIAIYLVERMINKNKNNTNSKDLFLPTYLLKLFKQIKINIPQSHLIISDFDQLITSIGGINAPIVSKKGFKS